MSGVAGSGGGLIQPAGYFQPLGTEDLHWLTPEAVDPAKLPPDVMLVLIGDARAFNYQIPLSRLRYRTVFDVKSDASNLVDAWAGSDKQLPGEWRVIDPAELRRFRKTYFGLPPLPAEGERAGGPFVIKR